MKYGDKRNYRKIDIFVNGNYNASTTWARTCKEAVQRFIMAKGLQQFTGKVTARFSKTL